MALPPIVFEDDALVAFDKPSGLLVAPDRWSRRRPNLMGLVRAGLGAHVSNVHRIDADTSGLVLCAKAKPALDFLSGQFQSKTVVKVYHALVVVLPTMPERKGVAPVRTPEGALPETFAVDFALGDDEHQPGLTRVVKGRGGKTSRSEFRVLENFGRFAFVECLPETGRRHQLRVHLAAVGAPILNDSLYGESAIVLKLSDLKRGYKGREAEKPLISRFALHASDLTVVHPETREPLRLHSPLPREFELALKYLRKFASRRVMTKPYRSQTVH